MRHKKKNRKKFFRGFRHPFFFKRQNPALLFSWAHEQHGLTPWACQVEIACFTTGQDGHPHFSLSKDNHKAKLKLPSQLTKKGSLQPVRPPWGGRGSSGFSPFSLEIDQTIIWTVRTIWGWNCILLNEVTLTQWSTAFVFLWFHLRSLMHHEGKCN